MSHLTFCSNCNDPGGIQPVAARRNTAKECRRGEQDRGGVALDGEFAFCIREIRQQVQIVASFPDMPSARAGFVRSSARDLRGEDYGTRPYPHPPAPFPEGISQ